MRIEQFYYLLEVARSQSMSKAAKKLFITQPTLSTAINNFETEMTVKIFQRSNNGVAVTQEGEQILQLVNNIVNDIDQLKFLASPEPDEKKDIHLVVIPAICNSILTDIIIEFSKLYPNIIIHVEEVRPEDIPAYLEQGQVDIVLGGYTPAIKEKVTESNKKHKLTMESLHDDEFVAFVGKQHPLFEQTSLSFSDLLDYPLTSTSAMFKDGNILVDDGYSSQALKKATTFSFTDRESMKKLIASGLAISYLPSSFAYKDLYHNCNMIKSIRLSDFKLHITHYLAYPSPYKLSAAEKEFISFVQKYYKNADLDSIDCLCY